MTQFKIEFLLAFTGCRKVLGKMPDIYIYIYILLTNQPMLLFLRRITANKQ